MIPRAEKGISLPSLVLWRLFDVLMYTWEGLLSCCCLLYHIRFRIAGSWYSLIFYTRNLTEKSPVFLLTANQTVTHDFVPTVHYLDLTTIAQWVKTKSTIPEALEKINEEMALLHQKRAHVRGKLNEHLSATRNLPPEVLTEIFRLSACNLDLREPQLYSIEIRMLLRLGSIQFSSLHRRARVFQCKKRMCFCWSGLKQLTSRKHATHFSTSPCADSSLQSLSILWWHPVQWMGSSGTPFFRAHRMAKPHRAVGVFTAGCWLSRFDVSGTWSWFLPLLQTRAG